MTYPEEWGPTTPDDMAKLHPSTWEQQCAQLVAENERLKLEAEGAAMIIMTERSEAKALRARVEALETALRGCADDLELHARDQYEGVWFESDFQSLLSPYRAALEQTTEPHTAPHSAKSDTR